MDKDHPASTPEAQLQRQLQAEHTVEPGSVICAYANWYRLLGTPEELFLELGVSPEGSAPGRPVKISNSVAMSFYTAKRLLNHLQLAVSRHEAAFGTLETDAQRRKPPAARG